MKWKESTSQRENPEPGSYLAWCIGLIDLGTQSHTFQGETRLSRDVRLVFELCGTTMTGKYNPELKGKPFGASITCRQSLHKSSKLRTLLESWRGRKFTAEELANFEPKKLLGKPARLTLVASETGEYINIDGISPVSREEMRTMAKPVNPLVYFSLDPDEFRRDVFEKLSPGTRERIAGSPEYRALVETPLEPEDTEPEDLETGDEVGPGDDIPF